MRSALVLSVGVLAAGTILGMVILWPSGDKPELAEGLTADTESAEVVSVETFACAQAGVPTDEATADPCQRARVRLTSGPDDGETTTIDLGAASVSPEISPGDQLRVTPNQAPPGTGVGAAAAGSAAPGYSLSDFERTAPVLWLAIGFGALVLIFGRWRGARSLIGLAISLLVVLVFMVPAILDGESPLAVAAVGSVAVMLVTISLSHGLGPKGIAAMLGTTVSLVLVTGLAVTFTDLAHLTGFASEEATFLQAGGADLSLSGLVVAGIVVAALGVLDDVTVSQASTVLALRAANPTLSRGDLYRRALSVGRDHLSATVNTLVLAYVGSSLPLMLILSSGQLGVLDALNLEVVATQVVAMLVGSIGLIAAVPITTAIAAILASELQRRETALPVAAGQAHQH
jgi:uncharacterized membrane protein